MATQAAYQAEKAIGHGDNAVTQQDVTTYTEDGAGESGETMKALAWISKNKVKMGAFSHKSHTLLTYMVAHTYTL